MKVLLVDDEKNTSKIFARFLEQRGKFNVVLVHSGEDAIDVYPKEKPDMVILDLFMPGMDGLMTLEALKKIDPNAVVLMLTAEKGQEFVNKAKILNAAGYITKPLDMERLTAVVNCLLTWNDKKNRPFTVVGELDA